MVSVKCSICERWSQMVAQRSSRRTQRRSETFHDIKTRAMSQISDAGVDGLSLNALARSMGMAPGALYRYFDSKDALLIELVADAYHALADALEHTAAAPGGAHSRFFAVAQACRTWALAQPNAYHLIFQHSIGSGLDVAPDRILAAAQRSMNAFLVVVLALRPTDCLVLDSVLTDQIVAWGHRAQPADLPVATLTMGLTCWYRLHGLISLEIGGHLTATGIDTARLYDAETRALLTYATTGTDLDPR